MTAFMNIIIFGFFFIKIGSDGVDLRDLKKLLNYSKNRAFG